MSIDLNVRHISLAFALSLPFAAALAHDAWIEADASHLIIRYGHADKAEAATIGKVAELHAIDASGTPLSAKTEPHPGQTRMLTAGKAAVVGLRYDNGYWTKTTDGSRNLPKHEVPGALSAIRSVKFGKTILAWSPAASIPLGQQLEILPDSPNQPNATSPTSLKVLWEGKPLAAAKLTFGTYGQETTVDTDERGRASVTLARGRQMLTVAHRIPLANDPGADTYATAASLLLDVR